MRGQMSMIGKYYIPFSNDAYSSYLAKVKYAQIGRGFVVSQKYLKTLFSKLNRDMTVKSAEFIKTSVNFEN